MAYSIELTLADALQRFVPELFIQQFLHWNRRSHLCGPSAFRQTKTVRCEQTHKNAVFGRGCVNTSSGKNHLVSFIKGGLKNKKQAKKPKTGLLSWDIREGWRQDLGIFFLFFFFFKKLDTLLGEKAASGSAEACEHAGAEHNSSKFNFLLDAVQSMSPWWRVHMQSWKLLYYKLTHFYQVNTGYAAQTAMSCPHLLLLCNPDMQLLVFSGRRVVWANHVASAKRGHLIHSGAVLAASPREAHLSVLRLRSLCESYTVVEHS